MPVPGICYLLVFARTQHRAGCTIACNPGVYINRYYTTITKRPGKQAFCLFAVKIAPASAVYHASRLPVGLLFVALFFLAFSPCGQPRTIDLGDCGRASCFATNKGAAVACLPVGLCTSVTPLRRTALPVEGAKTLGSRRIPGKVPVQTVRGI